jgi:acetylglutamate kinase
VDFGEVGDLVGVGSGALLALLEAGFVPIVSPLAVSEAGEVLNVNADTVAAHLAVALSARELVLLTRSPGVLADPGDPSSTLADTSLTELAALEVAGAIQGGMRPKIAAVRHALVGGVQRARVLDGSAPALSTGGTVIAA